MKTAAECKDFLVDFFKATPNMITEIYGSGPDEYGPEAFKLSQNPKNWKRTLQCKPGSEKAHIQTNYTTYWIKGNPWPEGYGYGIHARDIDFDHIAVERHFTLKEDVLGEGVSYIVLETIGGELLLGEYVGDAGE
jgi:hypothetical protein